MIAPHLSAARVDEKRFRIAMVAACPFPTSQGSQVLIRQLSQTLYERGHEVHLVTYHFGEAAKEQMQFSIHRIAHVVPYTKLRAGPSFRKPLLDTLLILKLLRIVSRYHIDIIHAHNYEALMVGFVVRALCGVRVVYHSHNAMIDELPTYFNGSTLKGVAKFIARGMDNHLPRHADHCIALNQDLVTYLQANGVEPHRITCLPPGAFVADFKRRASSGIIRKYRLNAGARLIYTGNLDSYQNLEVLFAAMTMVRKFVSQVTLLVVSHARAGKMAQLVQSLGLQNHVRFIRTNAFEDVVDLLTISDLAVIPRASWSGFPIKLLNYMAAGKAIIAAEGSAKNITHLNNGFVVPNYDVPALAEGIITLLQNPALRATLGTNAAQEAHDRYNWHEICSHLEVIYNKLCG